MQFETTQKQISLPLKSASQLKIYYFRLSLLKYKPFSIYKEQNS